MSLQVWLPLTKDLRQQGLSNATVTNNGATFDSMGKLGGCYTFGSGKYMRATPTSNLMQAKAVSVACWVKITSWNSSYDCLMSWADGTSWTNSRVTLARNNTSSNLRFTIADGTNYVGVNCTTTLALNTWYHVVGTYDGSNIKIYINGILEGTAASTLSIIYAGTFNIGGWSGNNYPINGSLNDIRLYNHCLSQMEIKELSKGLILHYPLNRSGLGQENFILESHKVTSGGNANGITRTYESDGSMKIVSTSGNGNYASLGFAQNSNTSVGNNMVVGDTYCISCDVKIETGTVLPTLFINSGNGYKQLRPVNGSIVTGRWIRIYYNSTWADPGTNYGNISLHLGFSGAIGTYYFKNFKLEKGSTPTPWCPNIADANNMGLSSTIEYDCSGYCNNGEYYAYDTNGSISYTSDTPRYNVSTHIISANPTQNAASGTRYLYGHCSLTNPMQMSVAFWLKPITGGYGGTTSNGQGYFCTTNYEYGNTSVGSDYQASAMNHRDGAVNMNDSASTTQCNVTFYPTIGEWHYYVYTYDGQVGRGYKDGVQTATTQFSAAKTLDSFIGVVIGFSKAGGVWRRNDACYSDFRVYATALSAEDVLELYHTAAHIDNLGNTWVYQYNEI